tara:strand:- start:9 stop:1058 length:1050 start_codon:yes stop_codon:yes gene_type:complete
MKLNMQKSILSFIGKKEIYPTIFYLSHSTTNDYKVEFISDIPINSIYICKIKWNYSKNDLHLYINKTIYEENEKNPYKFSNKYTTKNVSLLKSQIQKTIRRRLNNLSINIAYQFMNLDLNEFLRRLLIITLEDVILNEYFPIVTWMMVAYSTNKWKPGSRDIIWLLSYVNYLCNIDYREAYGKIDNNTKPPNHTKNFYNSLIFSMELRKSYGGMNGDMKFINWYITEWNYRFSNNKTKYIETLYNKMKILTIDLNMELVKPINMLEEGVDFHNYPQIINHIYSSYLMYEKKDIKKSIWEYNSKYNKRKFVKKTYPPLDKNVDDNLKEIWENIKEKKQELARKYLVQHTI